MVQALHLPYSTQTRGHRAQQKSLNQIPSIATPYLRYWLFPSPIAHLFRTAAAKKQQS